MVALNKVILAGNLTRDPQSRNTRTGKSRAGLIVAVDRFRSGQDGQNSRETSFITVTTWNTTAENCLTYLRKGMPVLIEGQLRVSRFTGSDGQQKFYTEVVADHVTFLSHGGEAAHDAGQPVTPEGRREVPDTPSPPPECSF